MESELALVIKDHAVPIVVSLGFFCAMFVSLFAYFAQRVMGQSDKWQDSFQQEQTEFRAEFTKYIARKDEMLSAIKEDCYDIKVEIAKHESDLFILKKNIEELGLSVEEVMEKVNKLMDSLFGKVKDKKLLDKTDVFVGKKGI